MENEAKAPKSDTAMKQWPVFQENILERLDNGKRVYGDSSFERPIDSLLTEIQQELEDVAGWSFILWTRLEALKERVAAVPLGPEDFAGAVHARQAQQADQL